jgi:hypothetical protein
MRLGHVWTGSASSDAGETVADSSLSSNAPAS